MTLYTSKGKTFEVLFAAYNIGPENDFATQFKDDRDISEIASDFEGCEWFKWTNPAEQDLEATGYSIIKSITRPQYSVDPSFVQIFMAKSVK